MFWSIQDRPGLHGVVMGWFDGAYHLFTTKPADAGPDAVWKRVVHHAVSRDLMHWETLPDALGPGPAGAFDGFTLYDLHVIERDGRYFMFYTGLDGPPAPGQRQAIGLAVSDDLIHWRRHPGNPVLVCDPRYYEPFIPDAAAHQEKDRGRQWFRDPWVVRDPATGIFGMAVGARTCSGHPDARGCIAWATSSDLIRWTPAPPLFAPGRFHTMECPVLFEDNGAWFLIWLTHPDWGAPIVSTDPWQSAGAFYAVSHTGLSGPYVRPEDEILVGGVCALPNGRRRMRAAVLRTVRRPDGNAFAHYHLLTTPGSDDSLEGAPPLWRDLAASGSVMPLPKPIRGDASGALRLMWSPLIEPYLADRSQCETPPSPPWRRDGAEWHGKDFDRRRLLPLPAARGDGVLSARIRFTAGHRAGLLLRAKPDGSDGLCVMLDRQQRCLEFGRIGDARILDRRRLDIAAAETDLRILMLGPSVEIYVNGRLMLHQVRYREPAGCAGMALDRAEALFSNVTWRGIKTKIEMRPL